MERQSQSPAPSPISLGQLPALTARFPILISDDDATIITLIKVILERAGFTAIAALDPRDTLAICRHVPVSLVTSDLMKPVMTGVEMFNRLRTDPVTREIPFVFVSTGNLDFQAEQPVLPVDGCLGKPFMRQDLVDLIRRVLAERGCWHLPATHDPVMSAALLDTSRPHPPGDWHHTVWTARRYTA
jgi:CheY-like chemotaxis protein